MCDKAVLRRKAEERRRTLKSDGRDEALARAFFASRFAEAESFFVYLSVRSEADTSRIVRGLLERGKKVCVPFLQDGEMRAVPYTDKLISGAFGIPSPEGGEDTPCEVALAPLLAADGEGYRLGYGGGYYDRYFASRPEMLRVGLMYAGQAVPALPRSPHDVPLDAAVTEEGVRLFGGGRN